MRYALIAVATVTWGLWFGGTIATFVFALYDFHHLPHEQFAAAAAAMFAAFSGYQLALGGVALLSAGLVFVTFPGRWTLALLATFVAAFGMAVVFGLGLLPIMQGLRAQGMAGSEEYMKLHGRSMATMTLQAVILLGSGALLPLAIVGRPRRPAIAAPHTRVPSPV